MSLQSLAEWLRCPNCHQALAPREPLALVCPRGHSFDANKRGFVSLRLGSQRIAGDSAVMLDARSAFLEAGWYAPLEAALPSLLAADAPARILDVGCGTGYYLEAILSACARATALGMDLSPSAVARTVRRAPGIDGLVADAWSPLPIRDATADAVLNVFAPRNPAEFHRVLRPSGLLAVVVPQQTHLQELRALGTVLDVQPEKLARLIEALRPWFQLESRESLEFGMSLSRPQIQALVGMGPSAHHEGRNTSPTSPAKTITAAFELLGFRRRQRAK